jgi:hypothetical protein
MLGPVAVVGLALSHQEKLARRWRSSEQFDETVDAPQQLIGRDRVFQTEFFNIG